MIDFLKKIYELRKQMVTLIVWEDEMPDDPKSYRMSPGSLIHLFSGLVLFLLVVVFLLLYLTPAGVFIFGREDSEMRSELTLIGNRLLALQDSLQIRELQLQSIKEVLYEGQDTVFSINMLQNSDFSFNSGTQNTGQQFAPTSASLSSGDFNFGINNRNTLVLPASYPIAGTLTQGFIPQRGHFGVDIAAQAGSVFYSIGDGVVVSSEWTINYGFVLHVQHSNGYITVYKHCAKPYRKDGDVVKRGDILGTISNSGVMSSGPHLHFEIWKDGVPLNPAQYFVNR